MTAATGIPVKSKTTSRNGAGGVNHTSGGGVGTTVASRIVKGQTAALSPTVTDHVPVGSVEILTSAHVSSGPGQIAHAPVPSVFVSYLFGWWVGWFVRSLSVINLLCVCVCARVFT